MSSGVTLLCAPCLWGATDEGWPIETAAVTVVQGEALCLNHVREAKARGSALPPEGDAPDED